MLQASLVAACRVPSKQPALSRSPVFSGCQAARHVFMPFQSSRSCGHPAAGRRPEDDGHVVKGQTGHGPDSKAGRFYVQLTGFPFPLVHLPWSG